MTTLEGVPIASILVTAGPTREHLDDVRYFANGSSGRMGYAIAAAGRARGDDVVLVTGPTDLPLPTDVEAHGVTSALEMQAAVDRCLRAAAIDLVIGVAAVSDYRPAARRDGKPARSAKPLVVELVPNPDILGELGRRKAAGELSAILCGFALEAGAAAEILAKARAKLQRKRLDMIVVNQLAAMGAGDNEATLVFADGSTVVLPRQDKAALATRIVDAAIGLLGAGAGEGER